MSSAPLMRVRRDTPYGAPPPAYGAPAPRGRVGPVYTFVKTDPQVTIYYSTQTNYLYKREDKGRRCCLEDLCLLLCINISAMQQQHKKTQIAQDVSLSYIVPITKKINKYFFILQFLQQGQYFFFFIRYLNCYEIFEKIFASYCILNYLFT